MNMNAAAAVNMGSSEEVKYAAKMKVDIDGMNDVVE